MKITYFILIFLLFSCNSVNNKFENKEFILGSWRLVESTDLNDTEVSLDPLLNDAKKVEEVKKGKVLTIFPDNTFTEISGEGKYISGSWKWIDEEKIAFKSKDYNITYDLIVEELETKKVQIQLINKKSHSVFLEESKLLVDFKQEPFYFKNNLWRIKPNHSENINEIQNRLGNYFQHITYILKAANEKKLNVISFEFSMGVIQIYNGGIGVVDFYSIPANWKNTFYNDEEAEKAQIMFSDYLSINRFRGAGTGSWVVDDYRIMLSIYGDLKSGKFK